jgi:hypothetical protein
MKAKVMMPNRILAPILFLFLFFLWGCGTGPQRVPAPSPPPVSLPHPAPPPPPPPAESKTLFVQVNLLNLRACPSTECQIITVLKRGQAVIQLDAQAQPGWLRVRVQTPEREGWVAARYLGIHRPKPLMSPPPPPPPAAQSLPEVREEWTPPEEQGAPETEAGEPLPEEPTTPAVKEEFAH